MMLPGTLTRDGGRFRALLLVALSFAFGACDGTDHLTNLPDESAPATVAPAAAAPIALFASSSARAGIPFGAMHVPNDNYGGAVTGALRSLDPSTLVANLQAARQAGVRVIVSFVGAANNYQNKNQTFSLDKWKARLNPYKGVDFSSYINDGTIIGHYILDEPHDPSNWGGTVVTPATVDEMARYSKQLWPTMPVIIRGWPDFLKGYTYHYLDAAWAQYSARKGPIADFVRNNVRDAKASGLALVVGLNVLDGGTKASGIRGNSSGHYAMNGSQLNTWGSALLADDYPCAFITWKWNASYMGRSDVKSAMASLSQKAQQHASSSCATSRTQNAPPPSDPPPVVQPPVDQPPVDPPPVVTPPVDPPPVVTPPVVPPPPVSEPSTNPSTITLKVTGRTKGRVQLMTLTWSGANGSRVDVYRNGVLGITTANDRYYVNALTGRARSYTYKVCEQGTSSCSNAATVSF